MDTAWFAVDGAGRVGLFETGENGAVPLAWPGNVDTAYFVRDVVFARDFLARFQRGEQLGHVDYPMDWAAEVVAIVDDPELLLNVEHAEVLLPGSPAVMLVRTKHVDFATLPGCHASAQPPQDEDVARYGLFGFDNDYGAPGLYELETGSVNTPLSLDQVPFPIRDLMTMVTFPDAAFSSQEVQLADHTQAVRFWYSGGRSLRGGPPDDHQHMTAPHPMMAWKYGLSMEDGHADARDVSLVDWVLPVAATLLAAVGEGPPRELVGEACLESIANWFGEGVARDGRSGLRFAHVGEASVRDRVVYALRSFAAHGREDLVTATLSVAARELAAQQSVDHDRLYVSLQHDLRLADLQARIRRDYNLKLVLERLYYARMPAVLLAVDHTGEAVLVRNNTDPVLEGGPVRELLAMLEERDFELATNAVIGPAQIFR